MAAAGFDPEGYSGHSLRAGFATSATRAGVSTFKIRQQTGHASDAMLSRYVRERALPRKRHRGSSLTSADSQESFAVRSIRINRRLEAQAALDRLSGVEALAVAHAPPGQQHADRQPR